MARDGGGATPETVAAAKRARPRKSWIASVAAAKTPRQRAAVSDVAKRDSGTPTLAQTSRQAEAARAQQRSEPAAQRQQRYKRYIASPRGQSATVARATSVIDTHRQQAQAQAFRDSACATRSRASAGLDRACADLEGQS